MVYFLIYLYFVLQNVFVLCLVLSCVAIGYYLLVGASNNVEFKELFQYTGIKKAVIALSVGIGILLLVPTKEQMLYIIGGGSIVELVSDDEVNEIPDDAKKILERLSE